MTTPNDNSATAQFRIFQDAQNWLSKFPNAKQETLATAYDGAENCLFNVSPIKQAELIAAYMAASKEMGSDLFGPKNKKLSRDLLEGLLTETAAECVSDCLYEIQNAMKGPAQNPGIAEPELFWVNADGELVHTVSINATPKSAAPDDVADALIDCYRALTKERPANIKEALNLCLN